MTYILAGLDMAHWQRQVQISAHDSKYATTNSDS